MTRNIQMVNEEERRIAVSALNGIPLSDSSEQLFDAMGDENWRVRKEAVEVFLAGDVTPYMISALIELLAEGDNAGLRNSASESLERLGSIAVPVLLEHLFTTDLDVRKFIVDILGSIGDKASLPMLYSLLDDPDPNVSSASAEALGKFALPESVPFLLQHLSKNDLCLQFTILEALSRIRYPVQIDALYPLLGNPLLKKAVFDCLGYTGDLSVAHLLVDGLNEKGRSAREAALLALVRIHDRLEENDSTRFSELLKPLEGTPLTELLISSLGSVSGDIQRSLIRLLGIVRDSRVIVPLIKLASVEEISHECRWAIKEIGGAGISSLTSFFPYASDEEQINIIHVCVEMGSLTCEGIIVDALSSQNPEVREAALNAIGELRLVSLASAAIRLLDDDESSVQKWAVKALVKIASEVSDEILEAAVKLSSSLTAADRVAAAHLLFAAGDRTRIQMLLKDEEAVVRGNTVMVIANDRSEDTCRMLLLALIDEVADVRIAAVRALGNIGESFATEPLLLLLDDPDSKVIRAVIQSLGKIRDPASIPKLAEFIQSSSGSLLINAMQTIILTSQETGSHYIEPCLSSNDEEVVKTAINLLTVAAPEILMNNWSKLIDNNHSDVRVKAASAMAEIMGGGVRGVITAAFEKEADIRTKSEFQKILDRIN